MSYTYIHGDSDADNDTDLLDFAAFQNCFDDMAASPQCPVFDFNEDRIVNLFDFVEMQPLITGP